MLGLLRYIAFGHFAPRWLRLAGSGHLGRFIVRSVCVVIPAAGHEEVLFFLRRFQSRLLHSLYLENFHLVGVPAQAPHVKAVIQARAGAVRVVPSLHRVDYRMTQVLLAHEGLAGLRLQVRRGSRFLHDLRFCKSFTSCFIEAEVSYLHSG